jgi:uncharacterized SAM-binding protein YcdF (DUF218 family)
MARRTSFSRGLAALEIVSSFAILQLKLPHMKRTVWNVAAIAASVLVIYVAYLTVRIQQQSVREEARPADVILVLGAAEYRGRPSPVLRARLDHALALYQDRMAPRILTTGGAGGDPVFTEGAVGRSYLIGRGVPSEAIVVETEGESTVHSIALAGEILRRMGLRSVIVVSDGYHIYRVKEMLRAQGLEVYGSPRKELNPDPLREQWNYVKQAIGYVLWRFGVPV